MQSAIPVLAHAYGEMDSRAAPTLKDSPLPVKSMSMLSSCQCIERKSEGAIRITRTSSYNQDERANAAQAICEAHLDRFIVYIASYKARGVGVQMRLMRDVDVRDSWAVRRIEAAGEVYLVPV
jgi:hypothetical protein